MLALLLPLFACGTPAAPEPALSPVATRLSVIHLAEVALPAVGPVPPRIGIGVEAAGISLDPDPWLSTFPEGEAPTGVAAVADLVPLENFEPKTAFSHEIAIPELADQLAAWRDLADPKDPDTLPAVNIVAAADAPAELVTRVLYSAYMAQISVVGLVVFGNGAATTIELPKEPLCPADAVDPAAVCAGAAIRFDETSAWVTLDASADRPACVTGPNPAANALTPPSDPTAAASDWRGRVATLSAGCPSAPSDPAAISALLVRFGATAPVCSRANVAPERGVAWQHAVAVLASLRSGPAPRAGLAFAGERPSEAACSNAFVVPAASP